MKVRASTPSKRVQSCGVDVFVIMGFHYGHIAPVTFLARDASVAVYLPPLKVRMLQPIRPSEYIQLTGQRVPQVPTLEVAVRFARAVLVSSEVS